MKILTSDLFYVMNILILKMRENFKNRRICRKLRLKKHKRHILRIVPIIQLILFHLFLSHRHTLSLGNLIDPDRQIDLYRG